MSHSLTIRPEQPATSEAFDTIQDSGQACGQHGNHSTAPAPTWDDELSRWRPPPQHLPPEPRSSPDTASPKPFPVSADPAPVMVPRSVSVEAGRAVPFRAMMASALTLAVLQVPKHPPLHRRATHDLEEAEQRFLATTKMQDRRPVGRPRPHSAPPVRSASGGVSLSDRVRTREARSQLAPPVRGASGRVSLSDRVRTTEARSQQLHEAAKSASLREVLDIVRGESSTLQPQNERERRALLAAYAEVLEQQEGVERAAGTIARLGARLSREETALRRDFAVACAERAAVHEAAACAMPDRAEKPRRAATHYACAVLQSLVGPEVSQTEWEDNVRGLLAALGCEEGARFGAALGRIVPHGGSAPYGRAGSFALEERKVIDQLACVLSCAREDGTEAAQAFIASAVAEGIDRAPECARRLASRCRLAPRHGLRRPRRR